MSEEGQQYLNDAQPQPAESESVQIPVSVGGLPSQEALGANTQYVNLAPENHVRPDAILAEVSTDERFKFMNPNRAQTILGEKIYHPTIKEFLFKDVEPTDQSLRSEHQYQYGWTKDRVGRTESGTEVHVRIGDTTSYVVEDEPYRQQEIYEHKDGVEISVTYEPAQGERRAIHYYMTGRGRGEGEKDVPEHITIYDSKADMPLTLQRWSSELRGPDPRFRLALQEMGVLLDQRITWNSLDQGPEPGDGGGTPSEFNPSPNSGDTGGQAHTTSPPETISNASNVADLSFERDARRGIAEVPVTSMPPPHDSLG